MNELKDRTILICRGKHCVNKGSEDICNTLETVLEEKNLTNKITVEYGGCHHLHIFGPIMIIKPDNILYVKLESRDINEIINQHIIHNEIVERLLLKNLNNGEIIKDYREAQKFVKLHKKEIKRKNLIKP
jgi:(2Fe-2S) ferredoxin